MLSTKRRVKKELFPKIMKEGQFVGSPSFYLRILNRKDDSNSLFSFVVPNKVKKTSVGRHLIKRKMSAVVEKAFSALKPGLSVIIFCKEDISSFSYKKIEQELLELLTKAKILI